MPCCTGIENVALGEVALHVNSTGERNTGIGVEALGEVTGSKNTGVGHGALVGCKTGSENTAIGAEALGGFESAGEAAQSVAVGFNAGHKANGSGNVFIGYQAGSAVTTGNNLLYISNTATEKPLIGGNFGTGVVTINGRLEPGASGPLPTSPTEGNVNTSGMSAARKKIAAFRGNGTKKAWKIKHSLETRALQVSIQKAEGEVPGADEPIIATVIEIKAISESEVELIFVTAPVAGVLMFATVTG